MQNPEVVYVPPIKHNIIYAVAEKPKDGISKVFQPIVDQLIEDRNMGRIIIFCKTYDNVINIYHFFKQQLREYFTEPKGSPNYVIHTLYA